ncbi:MAG: LysM peptidoglycan-binding domain-containing protein [Gemmatimonadetes bacterium]|nr:LysM peptidoglycan-binding domain-containing protein [Gemmatimonadota bacterium]NNM04005.1 LysM peptidoglycan-binding domain-containing protein [Gemmatimonadota bacterium]
MTAAKNHFNSTLVRAPASLCLLLLGLVGGVGSSPGTVHGQSLRGSTASLDRQEHAARVHDFTYLGSPAQVERFVKAGYLVQVRPNRDFTLHGVSYPFARPEARTFILRLSSQYRRACGEKLVVTSMTRPLTRQPRNASSRSVHPTGMAIDVRRSNSRACRSWLEGVLLSLEEAGVLEATRESYPPHYHVAVYPQPYARYVSNLTARQADSRMASTDREGYTVRAGDSLWEIAQAHGTTVDRLQRENNLRGSRIYAGQRLRLPASR